MTTKPVHREGRLAKSRITGGDDVWWIKADWYCPSCGKQEMYQDRSFPGSDYYHESSVTCFACGYDMCCVGEVIDEKRTP